LEYFAIIWVVYILNFVKKADANRPLGLLQQTLVESLLSICLFPEFYYLADLLAFFNPLVAAGLLNMINFNNENLLA